MFSRTAQKSVRRKKENILKTSITREGIYFLFVVLIVLGGAILREVNPMLLFSAFLCAPLIIAWRLGRRSLRGIRVQRRLPTRVFAGESFVVQLETSVSERSSKKSLRSAWGIVVVDRIRPVYQNDEPKSDHSKNKEIKPYEPAVYFEYLSEGQKSRKTYAGRIPQRGRYRVGPIMISTRFPFGFFRHWIEQDIDEEGRSEFCVYPKLGRISTRWKTRHHEAVESQQRRRFRHSRVSGEFLGVRRWQQGDAKKWIHWRASAKHDEPFVRQFEKNQNRDCAILIDLFRDGEAESETQNENFELAVSFTATLVSETTRRGGCDLFFATSSDGETFIAGPVCLPLVENVLHRLALAEPDPADELPRILLKTLSRIDPNADLILVSSRPLNLSSSRFREIQNDPRFRPLQQRLRIVDTSDPRLDEIFSFDET